MGISIKYPRPCLEALGPVSSKYARASNITPLEEEMLIWSYSKDTMEINTIKYDFISVEVDFKAKVDIHHQLISIASIYIEVWERTEERLRFRTRKEYSIR